MRDLHALNGRWPGVTVNVGKIAGGTRPNVVAERCDLEFDVRATARGMTPRAEINGYERTLAAGDSTGQRCEPGRPCHRHDR